MGNVSDPTSKDSMKTEVEHKYRESLNEFIGGASYSNVEIMDCFTKYVRRQTMTYFIARYELFKKIINVHGSIVECGVFRGFGLMSFAHFSSIFEPVNHQRHIYGFDTFQGMANISDKDGRKSDFLQPNSMAGDSEDDLNKAIRLYDMNRPLGHIQKAKLVAGNATETIPRFIEENPHLVVSLLYLDFDLYEPTKVALKHFAPRIPKGGMIAFDELNDEGFPGETLAVLEEIGIHNLKIQRFPFDSCMSYAVVE